jgi:phage terminase large subunit GpA-like protein
LIDWLIDQSVMTVLQKGCQMGGTTGMMCIEYHALLLWGLNQIHTFPTETDVQEFVPTKANKFIEENKIALDIDNTGIKGYGKGFLYYQGTFTKSAPIIISSDRNIYDEVDKSKMDVINGYSSRMGFSKFKREVFLSTPTLADFGINHYFGMSDQKYRRFNCSHCGCRQHMVWEENVDQYFKK